MLFMKSILIICCYIMTLSSVIFAMETTKKRERPTAPTFVQTTQSCNKKFRRVFSKAAIKERLHEYNYFLNHSPFLEKVADKPLIAEQIAEELYDANQAYLAFLKEQNWSAIALEGTALFNNDIIPLLLQEYPQDLTRLILLGWHKPTN